MMIVLIQHTPTPGALSFAPPAALRQLRLELQHARLQHRISGREPRGQLGGGGVGGYDHNGWSFF